MKALNLCVDLGVNAIVEAKRQGIPLDAVCTKKETASTIIDTITVKPTDLTLYDRLLRTEAVLCISRKLYEGSLGIVDIAVKLYISAQQFCINRGIVELTPEIIVLVSKEKYKLIQPILDVLREKNKKILSLLQNESV